MSYLSHQNYEAFVATIMLQSFYKHDYKLLYGNYSYIIKAKGGLDNNMSSKAWSEDQCT